MWELDHKEGWVPKNWCFQIVVLEKTLCESLGQRQDQTSQSQTKSILNIHWRDWCWSSSIIEAEAPIFWPTNRKSWLIGKDRDAGKDRGQEEKGMAEDEMVGWHQWTQWTWVWASSRSWWWTGKPGVLQSIGSQRVRHDWATELNWLTKRSLIQILQILLFRNRDTEAQRDEVTHTRPHGLTPFEHRAVR